MAPNFLFITTDQQRCDAHGCAGNAAIETPCLDALAARGVRFDRAYPSNPICMPSRATSRESGCAGDRALPPS